MTVGGMGFIPERLLMMMMIMYWGMPGQQLVILFFLFATRLASFMLHFVVYNYCDILFAHTNSNNSNNNNNNNTNKQS